MATFTIKIDRRSVRRNKGYKPPEPAPSWVEGTRLKLVRGEWIEQDFKAKRCRVVFGDNGQFSAKDPWGVKVIAERPADIEINVDGMYITRVSGIAYTPVEPYDGMITSIELYGGGILYNSSTPFRYKYVKTNVTCGTCGQTFKHSDLRYRKTEGCCSCGEGASSTSTACPRCGEWDCCETVLEKLSKKVLAQCARRNEERAKARKVKV